MIVKNVKMTAMSLKNNNKN